MQSTKPAILVAALLLLTHYGAAQTLNPLYSFSGVNGDGGDPEGNLVLGPGGELYGVTSVGGANGRGTVYQLTPPSVPGGAWTETVLYSFTGTNGDGNGPETGLVMDSNGVLYGTTNKGGAGTCANGCGTVFSLTPPSSPGNPWTETVLHQFGVTPGDGYSNATGLVITRGGIIYGATRGALPSPKGSCVFRLRPPQTAGAAWIETVLHTFSSLNGDGSAPNGVIIYSGALYGTTANGGTTRGGIAFKLSPPVAGTNKWIETILYTFPETAAWSPVGSLVAGSGGTLYGMAIESPGACTQCGTIFQLTPPSVSGGSWTESALYNFTGSPDGRQPVGLLSNNGVLYGATTYGGINDFGTLFSLTLTGSETVLASFSPIPDGATPSGGLVADAGGNLYGVARQNGLGGSGTVYQLVP
jgi:uncharacterized repeat protein (TIGR03803 family)